jgi:hypothetical protein
MKYVTVSILTAAVVLAGKGVEAETAPAPKRNLHLTLNEMALDRAFHGNFDVPFGVQVGFPFPSDQGFVLRQVDIPVLGNWPNPIHAILAVDSPAAATNPLAAVLSKGITAGAYGNNYHVGGTVTLDPPIIVPPGSTLNVALTGNPGGTPLKVGIRGYVIHPGEL